MVKEPWLMMPPPSVAVFPLTTDVVMVRMPELDIPPPNPFVLVFPLTSDLEIVSVPKFPIPPRPFVLVFALTDDLSIISVPLLRIPPPSALAVGLAPPVNVRPTTFTEPEETISGVPVPCASSVAGLPIKARSFDTENVPTHVPETKRDAPEEAASIAGCRAVGFTEQSTTTGPLVVTVKLTRLIAVPAGVTTLIGPVVASGGTVACACVSLRKANDEDEALLKFTATPPVKPVPKIVTMVPTGPLTGLNATTVGSAAWASVVGRTVSRTARITAAAHQVGGSTDRRFRVPRAMPCLRGVADKSASFPRACGDVSTQSLAIAAGQ